MKILKNVKFMWISLLILMVSIVFNVGCAKHYTDKDTATKLSPALNALVLADTASLLVYTSCKAVADSAFEAKKISLLQYYNAKRALCVFNGLLFLYNDEVKKLYEMEVQNKKITSSDVAKTMVKTLAADGDMLLKNLQLAFGNSVKLDVVNSIWDVVDDLDK